MPTIEHYTAPIEHLEALWDALLLAGNAQSPSTTSYKPMLHGSGEYKLQHQKIMGHKAFIWQHAGLLACIEAWKDGRLPGSDT